MMLAAFISRLMNNNLVKVVTCYCWLLYIPWPNICWWQHICTSAIVFVTTSLSAYGRLFNSVCATVHIRCQWSTSAITLHTGRCQFAAACGRQSLLFCSCFLKVECQTQEISNSHDFIAIFGWSCLFTKIHCVLDLTALRRNLWRALKLARSKCSWSCCCEISKLP